jgi:hypothetical protein
MNFIQAEFPEWTSLQGTIEADYTTLVNTFGVPKGRGDGYKVTVEWELIFNDGTVATIYDWKTSKDYCGNFRGIDAKDNTNWHVGGKTKRAVDLVTLELLGVTV